MTDNMFPHLTNATAYPGINNVDPYKQYPNTFDYNRWDTSTHINLCSVPFNSKNVADWTINDRDNYFDNLPHYTVKLESAINIPHDYHIKLPVPYMTAQRYNYVWVTYDTLPTASDPLDYTDTANQITRYGYYITSMIQHAASTTELVLTPDYWTTYSPYIDITYMHLQRGHAPMAASPLEEYLADPLTHSALLRTPDISFGDAAGIVRHHEYHPWLGASNVLALASSMSPQDIDRLVPGQAYPSGPSAPTYSDTADRYGYQYQVDGYEWDLGDYNFSNTNIDTTPANPTTGSYYVYIVDAKDAANFLNIVTTKYPHFIATIKAVWYMPADLIDINKVHQIDNINIYEAEPVHDLPDIAIDLSKDMFAYDEKYANITKLYTYPYAVLNISDNSGTSVDIRIEDTTDLTLHRRASTVYPYLKAQAFLTGAGGGGATTYEWTRLDGTSVTSTAYGADWQHYLLDYDIPTYAITMSGASQYYLDHAADLETARQEALNAYHKGMRGANTTLANTIDSANTAYDIASRTASTSKTNADASAATSKANADASASTSKTNTAASIATTRGNTKRSNDTAKTNADASTTTAKANADASATTSKTNADASANTAYDNAITSNATARANTKRSNDTALANANASAATANTNAHTSATASNTSAIASAAATKLNADKQADLSYTLIENQCTVNTDNTSDQNDVAGLNRQAQQNSVMAITQTYQVARTNADMDAQFAFMDTQLDFEKQDALMSGIGGAVSGIASAAKGDIAGAVAGVTSVLGTVQAMNKADTLNAASKLLNRTQAANANTFAAQQNTASNSASADITKNNQKLNEDITTRNNDLAKTNGKATQNLAKDINTRNYDTAVANANRTYNAAITTSDATYGTALANATRQYNTSEANADATKANADANALSSKTTALANNKRNYDTAIANNKRNYDTNIANNKRNYDTAEANATDTKTTADANNTRTYDTSIANNKRTYDTAIAINKRNYDTSINNATDTRDNTIDNATYTRNDVQEFANKIDLEWAQTKYRYQYEQAERLAPITVGSLSGDAVPDIMGYRGTEIRVKTQPDGAIAQAGDAMLRYGYAYDGAWTPTHMSVMPYYTYWQSDDIWISPNCAIIESAKAAIRALFATGITVWRDPNTIGGISIYDNQ